MLLEEPLRGCVHCAGQEEQRFVVRDTGPGLLVVELATAGVLQKTKRTLTPTQTSLIPCHMTWQVRGREPFHKDMEP